MHVIILSHFFIKDVVRLNFSARVANFVSFLLFKIAFLFYHFCHSFILSCFLLFCLQDCPSSRVHYSSEWRHTCYNWNYRWKGFCWPTATTTATTGNPERQATQKLYLVFTFSLKHFLLKVGIYREQKEAKFAKNNKVLSDVLQGSKMIEQMKQRGSISVDALQRFNLN